jgi:hypothetical protein
MISLSLLAVNYFVKPSCVGASHCWRMSPRAILWASGRRIGAKQMFPTRKRLPFRPSSPPVPHLAAKTTCPYSRSQVGLQIRKLLVVQFSQFLCYFIGLHLRYKYCILLIALFSTPSCFFFLQSKIQVSRPCSLKLHGAESAALIFFDRWIPALPFRCLNRALPSQNLYYGVQTPSSLTRTTCCSLFFWGCSLLASGRADKRGGKRIQITSARKGPDPVEKGLFFIIFEQPAKVIRSSVRQCVRCLCICDPQWWANSRIRPLGPEKVAAPGPELSLGGPGER